jgi:hypothetical protein
MGENTKFKEGKSHYESAASVEALRLYVDMVGAGGIFDLSSENTDFMKRVG